MEQLSLLEQARRREPEHDDSSLIERISAVTVRELDEKLPVDLKVVAAYRSINDIRVEPMPHLASLTPEASGLVMRLRAGDSWRRQRFGGFHDVGHTFQPGYYDKRLFRCAEPQPRDRGSTDPESLSDIAAAELLMPRALCQPLVRASDFDLASVVALADACESSVQASAYRFSQLWPEPTLVICLEPGFRKSEAQDPTATKKLRVVSAWPTSGKWPFIPKNKSAKAGGPLSRALDGEFVHEGGSLAELDIDSLSRLEVSARAFTYRRGDGELQRRVLAIYRQTREAHGA